MFKAKRSETICITTTLLSPLTTICKPHLREQMVYKRTICDRLVTWIDWREHPVLALSRIKVKAHKIVKSWKRLYCFVSKIFMPAFKKKILFERFSTNWEFLSICDPAQTKCHRRKGARCSVGIQRAYLYQNANQFLLSHPNWSHRLGANSKRTINIVKPKYPHLKNGYSRREGYKRQFIQCSTWTWKILN